MTPRNNFIKTRTLRCPCLCGEYKPNRFLKHRHLEWLKRSAAVERLEGLEQTFEFLVASRRLFAPSSSDTAKLNPRGVSAAGQMINRTGELYRKGRATTFRLLPDQCSLQDLILRNPASGG